MNGLEKAAVLLKNLAPDLAPKVLGQLAQGQADRLKTQMMLLEQAPLNRGDMLAILREIEQIVFGRSAEKERSSTPNERNAEDEGTQSSSGKTSAKKSESGVTEKPGIANGKKSATGSRVDHVVDEEPEPPQAAAPPPAPVIEPPPRPTIPDGSKDPIGALQVVSPEILAMVLSDESARTICVLLDKLDGDLPGNIFKRLPSEVRKELAEQFTKQPKAPQAVIDRIALAVLEKCRTAKGVPQSSDPRDRFRKIANMLRQLERDPRVEALGALEAKDPETAASVKELLYQFEDLMYGDGTSIQKLLAELDTKNLALALKGASEEIQGKLLNNLSKRAQETLSEEMALLGNVPPSKVDAARKVITEAMQALDARGEWATIN